VVVGMNMTFAGFAIGRVSRIELGDDGNARILVDVPTKDARWLRTSSVFTMERAWSVARASAPTAACWTTRSWKMAPSAQVLKGDAMAESRA
jgi:phospholipid/cholesterol/gamma-HCH transport system substrate-binding protein